MAAGSPRFDPPRSRSDRRRCPAAPSRSPWSARPMPRCRSTTCSARRRALPARPSGPRRRPARSSTAFRGALRCQRRTASRWRFVPESQERQAARRRGQDGLLQDHQHELDRDARHRLLQCHPRRRGAYFDKIQCFCFSEQASGRASSSNCRWCSSSTRRSRQTHDLDSVSTVTLSYTFFPSRKAGNAPVAEADPGSKTTEIVTPAGDRRLERTMAHAKS